MSCKMQGLECPPKSILIQTKTYFRKKDHDVNLKIPESINPSQPSLYYSLLNELNEAIVRSGKSCSTVIAL